MVSFVADLGHGALTQVCISKYLDRLVIIATQLDTLGTVLSAYKETVLGSSGGTYAIDTLLGSRDDPTLELCTRRLAETLCDYGCHLPLLLCLGFEKGALTPSKIKMLIKNILEHPVW